MTGMRLLLDTHVFLWFIEGSPLLSAEARRLIEDINHDKLLSIASAWEMSIKAGTGKLTFDQPLGTLIPEQLDRNGFLLLPIELRHLAPVATLPFHHRDPFDRLLIAQSLVDDLPLVSADGVFDAYGVTRLW